MYIKTGVTLSSVFYPDAVLQVHNCGYIHGTNFAAFRVWHTEADFLNGSSANETISLEWEFSSYSDGPDVVRNSYNYALGEEQFTDPVIVDV